MGRQAKRRRQRQQPPESPQPIDPQAFVEDFEQRGYSHLDATRSPELPDDRAQPQV
ncbi:MAG: hypothetical protein HC838_00655 [Spirulinaceae cyanobacterium RM2_2_10]|nr:hypothetical protein [Spirulinaceae cyanobacterium SM2_1_0]NJO18865.1 hypothetical protein [Spirulinaceae cyanobacterium RM2_2_10]